MTARKEVGAMWVVISLAFIFIIALFSVYNAEYVTISYILGTGRVRLALVIVVAALAGALFAALAGLSRQMQLRREMEELRSKAKKKEAEATTESKE